MKTRITSKRRTNQLGRIICLTLFFLLALLPLHVLSQSAFRELTFRVSSETLDVQHKDAYIIHNDTVFQSRLMVNGKVSFQIGSEMSLDSVFFALSDQEEHIYRINVGALVNHRKSIQTPIGEIGIVSNQLVVIPNENLSLGGITASSFRHFDLSSYTKERQMERYGCLRWYFPTELLMNKDSVYDAYLSQWYNEERYYQAFGQYPKEGFIDSIKTAMFEERAENLAGWYSEQLIHLNEPILSNGYPNEVYRLTWSNPVFYYTYNPYCMRVEVENGEAFLYSSYYKWDDCEGYRFYCDIFPLDKTTFDQFAELVKNSNLLLEKPLLDNGGLSYIFESYTEGKYHVVFRGKGESEALDEIQQFLWNISQLGENIMVRTKKRIE